MAHLSRRTLLIATAAGLARGADFWKQKEVADWTDDELQKFITRSPWAKEVNLVGSTESGSGEGLEGRGMGRRRERGAPVMLKAQVRWFSARIMLAALKTSLPETYQEHYVLAVTGLPLGSSGRREAGTTDDRLEDLKNVTTLRTTTQEAAGPDLIQRTKEAAGPFLFGFPKETLTIGSGDKEAIFAMEAPTF